MSPKVTISTLADLGPRNRLDAHCTRCRHSRRLDVSKLIEGYGTLSLGELRGRADKIDEYHAPGVPRNAAEILG